MPRRTVTPSGSYTVRYPASKCVRTGGTSLANALSDGSDSTYCRRAQGADFTGFVDLAFNTTTIPADEKIVTLMPYLRAKMDATDTKQLRARVGYYNPSTKKLSYANAPLFSVTGRIASATDLFRDRPASAGSLVAYDGNLWTQTHLDNASMEIIDQHPKSNADRAIVYEAAIDVYTLKDPSVSITAPTGPVLDTTFPDIEVDLSAVVESWQVIDSVGAQFLTGAGVIVRIFTAAQVAAPGFDPGTTPGLAANRVRVEIDEYTDGSTPSVVPLTVATLNSLPPNTALKIYARPWRGNYDPTLGSAAVMPRSQKPWARQGAWASADLIVQPTPPSTPTLTATVEASSGRVKLTATAPSSSGFSSPLLYIERSADAGTTWVQVIGGTELPVTFGSATDVYDYDAPAGSLLYRAKVVATNVKQIGSDWCSSVSATFTRSGWNLKVPADPTLNILNAKIVGDYETEQEETAGVFYPIGAEHPTVVHGDLHGEDGTLVIRAVGSTEIAALHTLIAYQGPVYLEDTYGGGKWITWRSRRRARVGHVSAPRMNATLGYLEVERPEA